MLSHYQILDLETAATPHEIRSRYRQLRNLYEDELGTYGLLNAGERKAFLAEVEEAHAVLADPARRLEYDRELQRQGHPGPWYQPAPDELDQARPRPVGESTGDREGEAPRAPQPPPALEPGQRITGAYLQACREARGVPLDELSQKLKITVTQLENIEQHRFERLPAPVYLKGFLRAYARAVGIDGDRVVEDFMVLRETWEDNSR